MKTDISRKIVDPKKTKSVDWKLMNIAAEQAEALYQKQAKLYDTVHDEVHAKSQYLSQTQNRIYDNLVYQKTMSNMASNLSLIR